MQQNTHKWLRRNAGYNEENTAFEVNEWNENEKKLPNFKFMDPCPLST